MLSWIKRVFSRRSPSASVNLPPFFVSTGGETVVCHQCKQLGEALPLPYPAIIIPTRPEFVLPSESDKIKAPKWAFYQRAYCVRHARKILRRMGDNDLKPGEVR